MKENGTATTTRNRSIIRITIVTVAILMIPLIAMQLGDEVNWGLNDFIVIGALLFGTGLIYELAVKKITNPKYRVIAALTLALALFLTWAELAVGLIEQLITGNLTR